MFVNKDFFDDEDDDDKLNVKRASLYRLYRYFISLMNS